MSRTLQEVAVSLVDVNGNAITNMSNATVLEGCSTVIQCLGAMGLLFEIKDTAVGTAVAPNACTIGFRQSGATLWSEDANFTGNKNNGGNLVANFWRNPAARMWVVPSVAGLGFPDGMGFQYDEARLRFTMAASANILTPVLRAWVLRDDISVVPKWSGT